LVQRSGIRKKPARKVPKMLPRVESAYNPPIVTPAVSSVSIRSFTANGETIPRRILAGRKRRIPSNTEVIRISENVCTTNARIDSLKKNTNKTASQEAKISIAKIAGFGCLSASLPPSKYPILNPPKTIPIKLVQTNEEVPI
jgi:hypothetical protein